MKVNPRIIEHLDPDMNTWLMTQLHDHQICIFFVQKVILSVSVQSANFQFNITPVCPSLCPAHLGRAHLSVTGGRAGPEPEWHLRSDTPRLRHQEPALARVSYLPDTGGDRWRDDGHSDIWDKLKKCREFLVSHLRGIHYLIHAKSKNSPRLEVKYPSMQYYFE